MPLDRLTRGTALVGDIRTDVGGALVNSMSVSLTNASTSNVVVGTLPPGSKIVGAFKQITTASDAGTTGKVDVGLTGGSFTGKEIVNDEDVKGAGTGYLACAKALLGAPGNTGRQAVVAKYVETGSASTVGAFTIVILYTTTG